MKSESLTYRSHGKLLLTAEYAVLDGAKALAIPTTYGQSLNVASNSKSNQIHWKSYNELGEVWFEDVFTIENTTTTFNISSTSQNAISKRLIEIFNAIRHLNSEFLNTNTGFTISTYQDFNRLWGLGTSSTLINNLADWAQVDAFQLLERTFGGSGYDIACAQNDTPISFQLQSQDKPLVKPVDFQPSFKDQLYFVYLNQKQNSRDGISAYKKHNKINSDIINQLNSITELMIKCSSLEEFQQLIESHELIIAHLINQTPIQTRLFSDFSGSIKSLGAWGGDFIMATSKENPSAYFNSKGLETIISYNDMAL